MKFPDLRASHPYMYLNYDCNQKTLYYENHQNDHVSICWDVKETQQAFRCIWYQATMAQRVHNSIIGLFLDSERFEMVYDSGYRIYKLPRVAATKASSTVFARPLTPFHIERVLRDGVPYFEIKSQLVPEADIKKWLRRAGW